jgi:hypothetical protein
MAQSPLMNSAQMWPSNPGLTQNAILGGTYNPNTMIGSMQHESSFEHTRSFTVEKVDNGFVLRSGRKAKVCKDMDELRDFFVAIMVEHQLDK